MLPERISRLDELSKNLWWSWNHSARELFRMLDHKTWMRYKHNPIRMINNLSEEHMQNMSNDLEFISLYDQVIEDYDNRLNVSLDERFKNPIVYFSFEYGLHQSLQIYSGGLGVLSGDTVKEASDMKLPYISIGFLYHQGYFKQQIQSKGRQDAEFPKLFFDGIPLHPLKINNDWVQFDIKIGKDDVHVQVWFVQLGQNKLYLIDTDVEENKGWYRGLSARLYGGDYEMRLNQEILLAFAGVKLLEILNITPSLWHLNEGHCAFLSVKRLENYIQSGKSFTEALELIRKTTVFTTHTPVPAGHDRFGFDSIEAKFSNLWQNMGITREEFFSFGMEKENSSNFNMTVLAMNTSSYINGVSILHTKVTQDMWGEILSKNKFSKLVDITNGVHVPTWISGPMRRLFELYVDSNWLNSNFVDINWDKLYDIPDSEFWAAKLEAKRTLFNFIRERARKHRIEGSKDSEQLLASGPLLDPTVLTIGFARRFATYKRANLVFRDINRIRKLLRNDERPIQIIFAGKAHPADEPGKNVLQMIYEQALQKENGGRIAFLEDYGMHIGRLMVQGVDVWMNTPIRPHEASGTSGMKAAMNGAPHFSINDGWWPEVSKHGENGWVIGDDNVDRNEEDRDNFDSNSLYTILEDEIIPTYYEKEDGISKKWIEISKESIKSTIVHFSTRRMLNDYINKMYIPAIND